MKKTEDNYDEWGNASHYGNNRIDTIVKYERIYGTLAVMTFCEINANKYRDRLGNKKSQTTELELLKIEWYENAARYYFKMLGTSSEIIINNRVKEDKPWI